ncbi:MAG: class I SAM-dependent methyltransferase [Bacteroidota bacterium]
MIAEVIRACPCCDFSGAKPKFKVSTFIVVKCLSCSLVYLGNPPKGDGLYDEYYSDREPSSDAYRYDSSDPALRELYEINQQRIKNIKLFKTDGKLLDIGCGRGQFLKTASEHGYYADGIDVSERAVAYARREYGRNAEVRMLAEVVASGEQFDVVTLWHVLEHFINPYEALWQISTLLKRGGICVVEVPNLHSFKFMMSKTKWHGGNHPLFHRTFFSAKTLRAALLRSGFSRVQRLNISYHVPGRNELYEAVKRTLNVVAMDAFLDFVAWK